MEERLWGLGGRKSKRGRHNLDFTTNPTSDEFGPNEEEPALIGCYYHYDDLSSRSRSENHHHLNHHHYHLGNNINNSSNSNTSSTSSTSNSSTSFCHRQQPTRHIVSQAQLSRPPQPVRAYSRSLVGSLNARRQLLADPNSTPSRRLNGSSAGCSASSRLEPAPAPQSRREGRCSSSLPPPPPPPSSSSSLNPVLRFPATMTNERRYRPRAVIASPVEYGSDESRTLRGSCSSSYAASQGGATELMLDTPNDFFYPFSCEATDGDPVIEGLDLPIRMAGNQTASYSETVLTSGGQSDQHPAAWLELDQPWSAMDMSDQQSFDLTQRPSTLIWPEETMDGPLSGLSMQRLNSSSFYPSHISSPRSNPSCSSSEIAPLNSGFQWSEQWPEPLSNFAFLCDPAIFPEDQNLADQQTQRQLEIGRSHNLPRSVTQKPPTSNGCGSPVAISSSAHFASGDFSFADWSMPLNENLLFDAGRPMDNFFPDPQPALQGLDSQIMPSPDTVAPTASSSCRWEPVVSVSSIQRSNKTPIRSNKRKKGCRVGPLAADVAERAGRVRKVGACWRCWYYHIPCSVEEVCTACLSSSLTLRICNRAHLPNYTELFFPALVASQRDAPAVQKLINDNVAGFTDNKIEVQMSSGPDHPPISMVVYEYIPANNQFLALYHAPSNNNDPNPNLEKVYAPPFGLVENNGADKLRENCREHIKAMIKHSRASLKATSGTLSYEICESVNRYRQSKRMLGNAKLLRKVVKLHAMHFFMSRIITFTNESAIRAVTSLRTPTQLPYKRSISSKLLLHQIKREMQVLQRDLTLKVLKGLEKELKIKSRASWATSFCVILILSMCMEAVQLAVDGILVQKMLTDPDGSNTLAASRDDGFEISRRLDDLPFEDCREIFHMIYKSNNERGFNPLRDGIRVDKGQGIDEDTVHLVNDIARIMRDYHDEIEERAKNPRLNIADDLLTDHYRFRKENEGRQAVV